MKKKADADRYAREQEALAQKAREVAEAEAERFKVEALAEAEANKTRLTGQAQAEAILARGAAEAEAKQKIADAFKEYGEAAVLSMVMKCCHINERSSTTIGQHRQDFSGRYRRRWRKFWRQPYYKLCNKFVGWYTRNTKKTTGLDVKELIENFSKRYLK